MSRQLMLIAGQFAAAALMVVLALWLLLSSWRHASGAWHLDAAATAERSANLAVAQQEARAAAALLPDQAAAILPAIDLGAPEDRERLATLATRCPRAQRDLVAIAIALSDVLHGQPAPELPADDAADSVLLTELARLRAGAPGMPLLNLHDLGTPHHSVLVAWAVAEWLSAVNARDWTRASADAGLVQTLIPDHPDAPMLALAALVLAPHLDGERLAHLPLAGADRARLLHMAERLARAMPGRTAPLMAAALTLPAQVSIAQRLQSELAVVGDQGLSASWVQQDCLANGRPDLAQGLIGQLPGSERERSLRDLRNGAGDLADLFELGATQPSCLPRISPPLSCEQLICFQLSNQDGMLPKANLVVVVNGRQILPADIVRIGPVIGVTVRGSGPMQLQVLGGSHVLYTGTIEL